MNSLMCVSFILRRLQPLIGEKKTSDRSYSVCFRPNKSELNDLYKEVEEARDFLWCIDMIYTSTPPAMNISSISLAPHAADRAAENQDRRKWAAWLKDIEREAEKGHVTDFDQNGYCTSNRKDRELEKRTSSPMALSHRNTQSDGSRAHHHVLNMDSELLAGHTHSREERVDGHRPTIPTRLTTRSSTLSSG